MCQRQISPVGGVEAIGLYAYRACFSALRLLVLLKVQEDFHPL
jgi:hypothetical protein